MDRSLEQALQNGEHTMANEHETCPTSLVIRKMPTETVGCHHAPIGYVPRRAEIILQ